MAKSVQDLLALNKARKTQGYKPIDPNNQPAVEAGFKHGQDNGYYTPVEAPIVDTTPEQPKVNEEKQFIENQFGVGSYENSMKLDPSTPYLENFYKNTIKQPAPVSEKAIENARLASGIGEGLQSLGEILGASRGARPRERDFSNSPIVQQTRNEKDIRNIYDQKEANYNNGLLNAKIGDYSQGEQTKQHNRSIILNTLQQYRSAQIQASKERQALQLKLMDLGYKDKDVQLKLKQFDEEKRKNRADESIKRQAITEKQSKYNADMDIVNRVRSLPVEWQKKMGFLKPVATEEMGMKKTEWTFDNSIKPEVLQAAVKQYESESNTQPTAPTNSFAPGGANSFLPKQNNNEVIQSR